MTILAPHVARQARSSQLSGGKALCETCHRIQVGVQTRNGLEKAKCNGEVGFVFWRKDYDNMKTNTHTQIAPQMKLCLRNTECKKTDTPNGNGIHEIPCMRETMQTTALCNDLVQDLDSLVQ